MIHKVEMFGAICDGCRESYESSCEGWTVFSDESLVEEEMNEDGWHITQDGKTYCPNCHRFDDDDKLILTFKK